MKNTLKYILAAALSLTFFACSDVEMTGYDESKTTGSIDLFVKDAATSDALDSVQVTYVINGKQKTAKSDADGRIVIAGLASGNYRLTLTRPGYASVDIGASITPAADIDMPVLPDLDITSYMYKEGVTLTGVVKITNIDDERVVQSGVAVDLELSGANFSKFVYSTTTDDNGEFAFENLPELVNYSVSVRRYVDGDIAYETGATWVESDLRAGSTIAKPTAFVMAIDAPVLEINKINSKLDEDDSLSVIFSQSVDIEEIGLGDIEVAQGFTEVAVNVTWTSNNTVMTVRPVQGIWGNTGNYTLSVSLKSEAGASLADTEVFGVSTNASMPGKVENFAVSTWNDLTLDHPASDPVDRTAYTVTVTWDELDGVDGYEIWRKRSTEDNFTIAHTINDPTDTLQVLSIYNYVNGSNSVTYMIVGFNDAGRSSFETATKLTFPAAP